MPTLFDNKIKATELNSEIIKRLDIPLNKEKNKENNFLFEVISEFDLLDVKNGLGELGEKLLSFSKEVDLTHPDIKDIFSFTEEFQISAHQYLKLAQLAREHNLLKTMPHVFNHGLSKEIIRKINGPSVNRMNVRFVNDINKREEIRKTRQVQIIDLSNVIKKGNDIWNSQPDSFKSFIRFEDAYSEEFAKVEKKANRYISLGCTGLHSEIMKSMEFLRQQVKDKYYGFNRVTLTNAAVILARSLDYTLYQPFLFTEFNEKRDYRVVVERNFFKSYSFEEEQKSEVSFLYQPCVYPLYNLWHIAPPNIIDIINKLETFVDGKPIFDHFGVIVPGIQYPRDVKNIQDKKIALDISLIKENCFYPILIGEVDNKCYFISYFC